MPLVAMLYPRVLRVWADMLYPIKFALSVQMGVLHVVVLLVAAHAFYPRVIS